MKKLAIAIAVIALIGTPAFAADMAVKMPVKAPPPAAAPAFSWTGWYIGGNLGGAWGTSKFNYLPDRVAWTSANQAQLAADGSPELHMSNVSGGGQIGYNW